MDSTISYNIPSQNITWDLIRNNFNIPCNCNYITTYLI